MTAASEHHPQAADLRALEEELLTHATRTSINRLEQLLHADFIEFGTSGKTWTRPEILDSLPREAQPPALLITRFQAVALTDDAALATYLTRPAPDAPSDTAHARRSSVWVRRDHRWQLRFHHATPVQPDTTSG